MCDRPRGESTGEVFAPLCSLGTAVCEVAQGLLKAAEFQLLTLTQGSPRLAQRSPKVAESLVLRLEQGSPWSVGLAVAERDDGCRIIFSQGFSFDPLSEIVDDYNDVLSLAVGSQ
ncbi:hypothetical protein ACLOJK_004609 [Asimina triloba]